MAQFFLSSPPILGTQFLKNSTLLLRQINPGFVQNGRVTSQAFRPTPKDENLLSVYDGDLISPEESFEHFLGQPGCRSIGVKAVSVADCKALDLDARPDPEPFPEHAVIDFSDLSSNQINKKAKKLQRKAQERGWLYQAER